MRRLQPIFAALLAALLPAQASAQLLLLGVGPSARASYAGPGDIVAGATAFWGLQAYSAAIVAAGTQKMVNLRRSSDSHTCDVVVSPTGGLGTTANCSTGGENGAAVATWCNATTCLVVTAYDQTGNGNDVTQAVAADQPSLLFNCIGSLPCLAENGTSQYLIKSGFAAISPIAISGVIKPSGSALGVFFSNLQNAGTWTGNYATWLASPHALSANNAANNAFSTGSTTTATLAPGTAGSVGATWASSTSRTMYLNGVAATTDTSSEAPTTQNQLVLGAAVINAPVSWFAGDVEEMGVWPTLSSANQSALCHNQFTRVGTAVSC